jgi:type VII secretion protein EccE
MTASPPRVRAVARVGTDPSTRSGEATLVPRRRPGHVGPVHVLQLLLVEAAVVGVLAAAAYSPLAALATGAVAAGLAVVALTRRQGRWWIERRTMARGYRRRRRGRPGGHQYDPRLTALQWLAPGLAVADVDTPDGEPVGVARDDAGWYAVAELTPASPMRDDPAPALPLDLLVKALRDAEQPGAVLQVVTHTVPAPSVEIDRRQACSQSYRDLLQASGPVPVGRVVWLAVRLDARLLAEAGGDDAAQAPTVVAALVRRVAKALRREGVPVAVLGADGLLAALARSCDLQPAEGEQPPRPREDWRAWHSGRLSHVSFWVRGWPPVGRTGALLDRLSAAPAALTSVALVMVPEGDAVDLRCLARVAAPPNGLALACQTVVRDAREVHADLFPLDGEHGPATYASAPTGGGAR